MMGIDYSSWISVIIMLLIRIMGLVFIYVNKIEVNVVMINVIIKMVEMLI